MDGVERDWRPIVELKKGDMEIGQLITIITAQKILTIAIIDASRALHFFSADGQYLNTIITPWII